MIKILLSLLILMPATTQASIMFSPQEVARVLTKRAQNQEHQQRNNEDCLECNGLLFQNEKNWSAWINGEKLSASCPQCREGKIKITAVNQNQISLQWRHKGTQHVITLKPNEHYDATLKKVIKST